MGEAKYRDVAQGVTEILLLKSLFYELGFSCLYTPILWCDNLAAKCIAENPVFHSKTKHIEIDVHFVREKVEGGAVDIKYVPSFHQVADIFTKELSKDRFLFLCDKLGLKIPPTHQQLTVIALILGKSKLKGHVEENVDLV